MSFVKENLRHTLFTWTSQRDLSPLALAGGEGAWFWDAEGRRYLDLASVAVSANAGHNHPRILAAMRRQLGEMVVASPAMATAIRGHLATELAKVVPQGLDHFLFTLGGADANEHAVKIAQLVTGRHKVICRINSYHGASLGALSFSDDPRSAPFLPALPGVVHAKDPYCFRCPWNTSPEVCHRPCASHVEDIVLAEGPSTIAAVLMETVPGTNGGYFPPPDYYQRLRQICNRHDILLILDEVLTGFGRTGKWFAVEHYDCIPDIMTLGKGITSGHAPLGAIAVNNRVAHHFDTNVLMTGLTHSAHPISLAAALGNLEALREQDLVNRSQRLGKKLEDWLRRVKSRSESVADVRSAGLYGCVEFKQGIETTAFKKAALERGVYLLVRGRCLFLAPPLVISEQDLTHGLELVEEVLVQPHG